MRLSIKTGSCEVLSNINTEFVSHHFPLCFHVTWDSDEYVGLHMCKHMHSKLRNTLKSLFSWNIYSQFLSLGTELYIHHMLQCKLIIIKGISSKIWTNKYDLSSYLEFAKILAQEVEQILNMNSDHIYSFIFWSWSLFLLWVCIKAYDGDTNLSPNLEIESKYFRRTMILVYSAVLSAYVYTYVALHIRRCLKC